MNKIKKIANNLITPGGTLSQRVVKGGFWVFFLRIINQGFSLIRLIILARILSPNDFGLMGIALLTMSVLETFTQTGFQAALIQKKEEIKSYLDSAWTVLIFRGFVLFVILYFIAPYAAAFFNSPEAKPIIRIIGFSILFQAFTNIGITYFKKELEFNKEFIYQLSGTLADFVVAVSAVLILKNVWALVFGLLAGNAVRCFVSYLVHPCRPHLSSNLGKAKELFGFGKWILGSSILIFLLTQGDDIFVGKLLGTAALGFYQLAYRISNLPATEIAHVISQVTFPAYSKLQDNIPKLKVAYLKVLQLTAFLSFPIAGLIFVLAPDFTKIFLGEKWMPMVPAMQALCIFGVIRALSGAGGSVVLAIGKPKFTAYFTAIQLFILALTIYPLTIKYGILGTAVAVTLSTSIVIITGQIVIIFKIIDVKIHQVLNLLSPIFLATIIPFGFIFVLKNFIKEESNFWIFLIFILFYIVSFLILFNKLYCGKIFITLRRYKEIFLYDSK